MSNVAQVIVGGRVIFVEVTPIDNVSAIESNATLPRGAEATAFGDRLRDATGTIRNTISGVASAVLEATEAFAPDECEVEIGMVFKGENQPIPVLVKIGGEASIKVKAKWVKPKG